VDPTSSQEAGRTEFVTAGGVAVTRTATPFDAERLADIARAVDTRRGGVLSSGMEYPGRYSRWHMAYVDPCIEIVARGRRISARALNERGSVLLPVIGDALRRAGPPVDGGAAAPGADPAGWPHGGQEVEVHVPEPHGVFTEEQRSRRPTVFTALREVIAAFAAGDPNLGLYGAFGYDLAFQFEPITFRHQRPADQRDLVLHLPDELYMVDRKRETAVCYSYEFEVGGRRTNGLPRQTPSARSGPEQRRGELPPQPEPGSYARVVAEAKTRFRRGDLFEVVPGHVFHAECGSPAAFYEALRQRNPAPYEFFLNLGDPAPAAGEPAAREPAAAGARARAGAGAGAGAGAEYLVGASPEMYVRVTGDRVETCPISGTIARGIDPLGDARNIQALLNSAKDESELTMCTDVDRNDKARVCVPGSVTVIGRRQIEMYSALIHTVDHIEGRLRPGLDALDAFLSHMWAVTVTGAPKTWAMQFIEQHEAGPRRWYGGAVGKIGFDGSMNTGLTLRTAHITGGVAAVRAGATLLHDSDPEAEERETHLKARALLQTLALARPAQDSAHDAERLTRAAEARTSAPGGAAVPGQPGDALMVLLVDHQDSFVNTLGDYFRQQGARVTTLRSGFDPAMLDEIGPDLVVLSPGPGRPSDFGCDALLKELDTRGLPVFGVCLGLQAMVEHAGGTLGLLAEPVHGKPGQVRQCQPPGQPPAQPPGRLLAGLPAEFIAGRYHSLHAVPEQVRGGFEVTAVTADGVVMAIEDAAAARWAVQFHPESILTAAGRTGHQVIANVLALCRERMPSPR
jgi:anthranilate synthase